MAEQKKKHNFLGISIFLILAAAVVVGAYLYITREGDTGKTEIPVTETEKDILLRKDLEVSDYPVTPREVVKLFGRYTKCLYNDDLSEDDIRALMKKLRNLYSVSLLFDNSEEDMFGYLLGEINHYHDSKMTINSYTVDAGSKTKYITDSNSERAIVAMYFTIRSGSSFERAYEEFVLIKEEGTGRWKILGWQPTSNTDIADVS